MTTVLVDGSLVRTLRQAAGWPQTELARRAGIGQATVSRLETSGLVSPVGLARVAGALRVKRAYLMATREEDSERGDARIPPDHVRPLADTIGVTPQRIAAVWQVTPRADPEPDALTPAQQDAVERAAARRGVRDAAIIAVLLYAGATVGECARLDVEDVTITARTGAVRLHDKRSQVRVVPLPMVARKRISAWIRQRGPRPGELFVGQRGWLSARGIAQVLLRVGWEKVPELRSGQLRHTCTTRLRQGVAYPAHIQGSWTGVARAPQESAWTG